VQSAKIVKSVLKVFRAPKIRSNAVMLHNSHTDERLMALEIKSSYAEDLLEQLNQLVYQQQQSIDALLAEVSQLRRQMPEGGPSAERNLRDELPPHY
jgi:SlyX protein